MFNDYYRGKKILVTGHTGFKGAWLSQWLIQLGANVTGVSIDIPTNPSLFDTLELSRQMTDIRADIGHLANLQKIVETARPEVIFHLAAQPLVRSSYEIPVLTFATNLMGTVNLLEAQRKCSSVRAVVVITTDKCYQNQEWVWGYRENDALGGHDPYSASKACAEIATKSYAQSFPSEHSRIASVRAGNVIGGGDWAIDRLVPDAVRVWSNAQPLFIRSPHAVRPWQHVLEPLSAYLWIGTLLAQKILVTGESFNIGPLREGHVSVETILNLLKGHWGKREISASNAEWMLEASSSKPTAMTKKETNFLSLNCDKADRLLRWSPVLTLNQSVEMTASWYLQNHNRKQDATKLTLDQIYRYESLSKEASKAFSEQ